MTVVIKSYRFDLPPPAFTESNYAKGHWDIIHTLEADLKDYPDLHECLGVEMIISDRIYDGDNINFKAVYLNQDTGEVIFTSEQVVPDPGDSGYNYWNSYRIASWIGHCHWEIDGPMTIKISVIVKKGLLPIGLKQFIMTVTETIPPPPPPGECPDFWEDPVGWTLCTITNGFSVFADWFGGAFWGFITAISDWMTVFGSNLAAFMRDPVSKIQEWGTGFFVTIGELTNQISTGISEWWTQGIIDVGVMITNATQGFSSWIDERFTGINDWWADAQTAWGTFWEDRFTDIEDWISDFVTNVNNWWDDTKKEWALNITGAVWNVSTWINQTYSNISAWWTDRVVEVGVLIADATAGANEWITGFPALIADWWSDRVIEVGTLISNATAGIKEWVEEGLPGWVETMFEWAKPLVSPIIAVAEVLGKLLDVTEQSIERTPEEQAHIDNRAAINDRIKEIVGGR